jgi:hypothetical protein
MVVSHGDTSPLEPEATIICAAGSYVPETRGRGKTHENSSVASSNRLIREATILATLDVLSKMQCWQGRLPPKNATLSPKGCSSGDLDCKNATFQIA